MNLINSLATVIRLIFNFAAPLSAVVLMMFGNAFFTTFLSVYLNEKGYSDADIGIVQSAYFLGVLVGGFQMEKVIRRVGHIQALAVFGSLATSAIILLAMFPSFLSWIFLRFTVGLSIAAIYIVIESWMLNHSSVETRGAVLALYMMALYTSQSLSQQLLSIIQIDSYIPFLLCALFTSLSIIPVGLSTRKMILPPDHHELKMFALIKKSPFGFSGCIASGMILSAIYTFFPLLALNRQIPPENLMSMTIFGGVLLQWPIGKFSDYFERRKTLLATVLLSLALACLSLLYTGNSPIAIYSIAFFFGGMTFTLYPLCITQVCDRIDHSQITTATALLLVAYGFGCVAGPIVSSGMIQALTIDFIFLYFILLLAGLTAVGIYSLLYNPVVSLADKNAYVPLTNVTPIAYEMDPLQDT